MNVAVPEGNGFHFAPRGLTMSDLLHDEIDKYADTWKRDHVTVMENYAGAEVMSKIASSAIQVFDLLVDSLRQGASNTFLGVECSRSAFTQWYRITSAVMSTIDRLESDGFSVESSSTLRTRLQEASGILEELSHGAAAIAAVRHGRAITSEQFIDELRGQIHG